MSTISNKQFLHSLLVAIASLLLSAAILIPGYLYCLPALNPELGPYIEATPAKPQHFAGRSFTPVYGEGKQDGTATIVTALNGDRTIIARRAYLKASDYPFLRCSVEGQHPGLEVFFFWRTLQSPKDIFQYKTHWVCDNGNALNLTQSENWKGTVTEMGFVVAGELREAPLRFKSASLEAFSYTGTLAVIWAEWTAFSPWVQASIFAYRGIPIGSKALLYPVPMFAAWAGLALTVGWAIVSLLRAKREKNKGKETTASQPYTVVIAVLTLTLPWVILDMIWQSKLSSQNTETRYLFAGKTHHEKMLADWDGEYYEFAQYIKSNVLPRERQKISILAMPDTLKVYGYRLRYHLLPEHFVDLRFSSPLPKRPDYHRPINGRGLARARKSQYYIVVTAPDLDASRADLLTLAGTSSTGSGILVYANKAAALYQVTPNVETQ
jgi:hypothetical protein